MAGGNTLLGRKREAVQFTSEDEDEECPDLDTSLAGTHITGGQRGNVVPNGCSKDVVAGECSDDSSYTDDEDDETDTNSPWKGANDEWKQYDGASISCVCIACSHTTIGYEAADLIKLHLQSAHNFSIEKLKEVFGMDFLDFVKFVKWGREMKADSSEGDMEAKLTSLWTLAESGGKPPWDSDKYLQPDQNKAEHVDVESDYLLTLDFQGLEKETAPQNFSFEELLAISKELAEQKDRMTKTFQRVVLEKDEPNSRKSGGGSSKRLQEFMRAENLLRNTRHAQQSVVVTDAERRAYETSDNEMYFGSYDDVDIHHEMIFDKVRTDAYLAAINERKEDLKDALVLDIGCGSGILSMLCAKHGTKKVYAIDKSNIIHDAMSNCFENGFDRKIEYLHKDIDNEQLSIPKVDFIISEFMGYFLFFEGMTETVIRARDKYLKPGGVVMPNICTVEIAPLGRSGLYTSRVLCWENVYGFKMPSLQTRTTQQVPIDTVPVSDIIGPRVPIKTLDLSTCAVEDIKIDVDFELKFEEDTELCGIVGFFSVSFTGTKNVITLETSPWNPSTHWKQAIFFLPKPIKFEAGKPMSGRFKSHPHPDNPRWLVVFISIGGINHKYEMK